MNSQEREVLSRFLQQLTQARVSDKNREAEQLIQQACQQQPDAAYLLVQRALLLEQAHQQAQQQIQQLQQEISDLQSRNTAPTRGFLDQNAWGHSPSVTPPPQRMASSPVSNPPSTSGNWGGSFLGNVASTAAGVVAGSFLFQGIESLFGHHHSSSGLFGSNSLDDRPVAITENNYTVNEFASRDSQWDDAALSSDNTGNDDLPDWN